MRGPFWGMVFASWAVCQLAQGQDKGNAPAAVYLHAWHPEIGPLPEPSRVEDRELMEIAAAARAGSYRSAGEHLKTFRATYKDQRSNHLSVLFERDILLGQALLVSGGIRTWGEEANLTLQLLPRLEEIDILDDRFVDNGDPSQKEQAGILSTFTRLAFKCLIQQPAIDREWMIKAESPEYAKLLALRDPRTNCSGLAREARAKGAGVFEDVSGQLFELLVEAMEKQGRWEFTAAQSAFEKGLRLAQEKSPVTAALWMLHLGDLQATPYGSPLSMGFHLASEELVRPLAVSKAKESRSPAELGAAQAWYDRAATLMPGGSNNPELLLRFAYLAFQRMEGAKAVVLYQQAARAAHDSHQTRLEAMALGARAVLTPTQALFREAIVAGGKQQGVGVVVSVGEMALSAAWRARTAANPLRALSILDASGDALRNTSLVYTAIELLQVAARIDRDYGRNERAIDRLDQIVTLRRDWITRSERLSSKQDRDTVTKVAKQRLAQDLLVLGAAIQERVREEGIDAWRLRLDAVDKQIAEVRNLIPPDPELEDLKRRSYESYQLSLVQKQSDCAMLIGMYRTSANPTAGNYPSWLQKALPAARCDPKIKQEAAAKLATADALGPWLRAAEELRKLNSVQAGKQITSGFARFAEYGVRGAIDLGAGDLLADWVEKIEEAVNQNLAVLDRVQPYARLYRAQAQLLKGQAKEAGETLNQLRTDSFWSSEADPVFRSRVSLLLAETENRMQHPITALLALEWYRLEEIRSQEIQAGLRGREPTSVELEMLMRQAAMGVAVDRKRMAELTTKIPALRKTFPSLPDEAGLRRQIAQLPNRTVVLVYEKLGERMVLWRLEREMAPLVWILTATQDEVQTAANQLNRRLMNRESGWQTAAKELWNSLVVPAGAIPANWTIAIMRPPNMEGIPFDALGPDAENQLIGTHPIVYLTALMPPVAPAAPRFATGPPVVIGQSSETLGELDREVSEVAEKIGASVLSGPQARVAEVTAALEGARVAHIASHAVIDRSNRYRSYLALADGPLEAWELFQHFSANELLVLSACDSSRGAAQPFGGEHSLASLALLAGVRRIVSSQWKANDYESRLLMVLFYGNLRESPALALQQAKIHSGIPLHHLANFILTVRDPSMINLPSEGPPR